MRKLWAGAVTGLTLVGALAMETPAGAGERLTHCVAAVSEQRADGELILAPARCYPTFEGAMMAEGLVAWGEGAAERAAEAGTALLFTLATHYDYTNLNPAGGSFSVSGTSCIGGWTNMPAGWNNRISSTANGCPTVTHYDGLNLGTPAYATTGAGGNLNAALNNRASSVRYS
jgi:hypothetical protein